MDKLRTHFDSLDQLGQLEMIYQAAKTLKAAYIARDRAIDSYVNHNDVNRGPRGGRHATLCAKMDQATERYLEREEFLKKLVSFL